MPLGTPGPPTWAPGLTHLAHAGPWGHTRLRPPRWPALAGAPGAGRGVCARVTLCAHVVPGVSLHTCLQLCTAPWGSMALRGSWLQRI